MFYSSNKKVATVGVTTGKLKAIAKGSVKITAKNKKTGKAVASKTFKVLQRCQSVSVDEKEVYLDPNDTTVLKAKLTPESSTDIIRFYSSDKNVATVGATSGKLKAVREGKTTIMVYAKATKATSNSSKYNKVAKVNVYVGPHMYKVSQISTTEVKVFFKKDVEKYKLRASDFSIINNVTKASCSIKEISVNGNKVNLTTYNEIKDDNEVGVIDTGYVIIRAYKNPNETVSLSPSVTPSPSPSLTPSPTPTPTQTPTPIYYYTWTPAATSSTTPSTGGAITITSAPAPSPSI